MKSFEAEKGLGMSEEEVRKFLSESKSTLILGTSDPDGTPSIHPTWFCFDSGRTKLYLYTGATTKKAKNIRRQSTVYFDVDVDRWPYKGVKGKGDAMVVTDSAVALSRTKEILDRYVKPGHSMVGPTLEGVKKGKNIVVEITPAYFSSWDYGKLGPGTRNDMQDAVVS